MRPLEMESVNHAWDQDRVAQCEADNSPAISASQNPLHGSRQFIQIDGLPEPTCETIIGGRSSVVTRSGVA